MAQAALDRVAAGGARRRARRGRRGRAGRGTATGARARRPARRRAPATGSRRRRRAPSARRRLGVEQQVPHVDRADAVDEAVVGLLTSAQRPPSRPSRMMSSQSGRRRSSRCEQYSARPLRSSRSPPGAGQLARGARWLGEVEGLRPAPTSASAARPCDGQRAAGGSGAARRGAPRGGGGPRRGSAGRRRAVGSKTMSAPMCARRRPGSAPSTCRRRTAPARSRPGSARRRRRSAPGASSCGRWPTPSKTSSRLPGIASCASRPCATGMIGSRSPQTISTGMPAAR